jgi:hypothetical protein
MVVLAFLADPEVVREILLHLELPMSAPALPPVRSSGRSLGLAMAEEDGASVRDDGDEVGRVRVGADSGELEPIIRPPP